ncbi:phage tail spike protein [Bacillus mycoides]|uniref:phage tail spike protein n=1 Tax=Bacillus mycoides TaxID=1405 RepID=UPI0036589F29
MRTPSGILHVVDFKTDQIVSAIQPQDYWDDKRHWEIKNNIDMLDFTTFDGTKHAITLQQQNLVLKEVRDGRVVPYVITEAEKDSDKRSITTYASGAWVQIAKSGIINPQRIESKTVNEFIDMALLGMKWKRGNTEYAGFHTMTIDEFIDPLTFLKKIASLFDLEIQYRVEVVGSQTTSWYVDMVKKRGQETGKEIELGKDLVGVKRIEHSREICTALVGFVRGEEEKVITVESINNGLPYITDSDAFQRWNEHGKHKFGFYTPETEEQNMTPQRLMTLMKTEFKKRVNTSVSYEVEAQSIGRVFGLAHELINEGDTIKIKDTGFTPELYLEARVIAGDESFTNPTQDKYVFGDYREIVDPNEELRKIYNRILSSLGNKQEMLDQLDKLVKEANETASNAKKESEAAKILAEKVQENVKNNTVEIIESKNPPTTNLKDRKTLWLDISNGKPGILKLWKDGIWDPVVPDVEKAKKETLEQVNKDIESTKTELNQKVQTVENKAKEIAGQIVDVQKQVNGKVDQTWINAQLKDKADKSGVFTKDEINNGFIGKQIYETDKQGNVKKFQEISTSFEQTNEAIKSKAEKQSVTDLGNNLTQVSKTANEAKQTAEGTKQTITELKSTVENTEIGVRNLLLETAIKSHSVKTGENKPHTYFDVAKDAATLMQGKNLAMSFLFTGKVTAWGTTNKWAGFEVKITFTDNTFHYPSCRVENRLILGKQYNQERFTATSVVMDKPIKEISVYALGRDFTGEMLIEKPKLEIGTVPTAWTPAPEDQVTTTDFTKKTVEIEENINGIKNAVSTVQNEQGKLTERVTKSEQTADGFKQSIESLTKKDTEISNKVSTVELTVEGTKKTITDVQQTTNELKKTTTEITEKAGKISEKLESIEKKFDDIKIGGQNFYKQKSFGAAGGTSIAYDDNNKWWNITIPAGASGSWKGILYNTKNATLLVGRTYTISYEIYADEVIPTAMDINNFGVTSVTGTNDNDVVAKRIMRTPKTIAGQWVKVSATLIMPDNITQDFYDNSVFGVGGGWTPTKITNIKIRNMQLEEGNIPTSYRTPSEDQVTTDEFTKKTNEITKSVDGIKETITKVENSQSGFDKRVATVEKDATTIKQNVSSIQDTQTTQGRQLQEAKAGWENTAKALEGKVEIKQVEDYVAGFKIPDLKNTVNKNKEDLLAELANKLATEQYNQKMTLIDNRFSINEKGINASAKTTDVYTKEQANGQFATSGYVRDMESRLQLTEKGVSISVKENDVIAAFNMSKENITLNANRINLVGFITANHIKGQVLEGVTLKTSGNRFVEINKQDMKIFDLDKPRGYMGFMETDDGSIQPALVLGSDNRKFAGTGSFYIYQKIPRINGTEQPSKAFAKFGISKGENAEGTNVWSSYIQMSNDGGHLYAYADGRLYFDCLNDIVFNSVGWAPGYGKFMVTTTEPHYFKNNYGEFHFDRKSTGNSIYFVNGANDHDLVLGRVMIRSSLVSGYDTGLQIKDTLGNGWRDIELRTLRAKENISATGGVWAREFIPNSSRKIKTNIEDLKFSALQTLNSVRIKKYNMISDVEKYNAGEIDVLPVYYGMIAEDSDSVFTTPEKNAVTLYSSVSITMQSVQELDWKADNMQFDIGMVKQALEAEKREKVFIQDQLYELKDLVVRQEDRIAKLEELLLEQLIDKKPEQP